jgi:predicted metal-dependent hydrolase
MQIPYTIRVSPRARSVRLKMSPEEGLVVVIPRRFPRREVPEILAHHRRWIENAARRIAAQRDHILASQDTIPDRVELAALGEIWTIESVPQEVPWVGIQEKPDYLLSVCGKVDNLPLCRLVLRRWLNQKAKAHLIPWLETVANKYGFSLRAVSVRAQKSRWGSCSREGRISLNQKLLFMPPPVVEYLFLHELCHLAQANHGPGFYDLLARLCPNYREYDKFLRTSWQVVPPWADGDKSMA